MSQAAAMLLIDSEQRSWAEFYPDDNLEELAACPRGFMAASFDPATMQDILLAQGEANPDFSNATMTLEIGTFSSHRIDYVNRE